MNTADAEGDIYLIEGGFDTDSSVATQLLVDGGGISFMSVQVTEEVIMAGERYNADVWISRNGGDTFDDASKPPTGTGWTQVLISVPAAFDPDTGIAYAVTSGPESAFSYTVDGGNTWNQTNFVDTEIDDLEIAMLDVWKDLRKFSEADIIEEG